MQHRALGNSDLTVSSLGMGCVTFGREIDAEQSFRVLDRALERGITLFDTAEAYAAGASETVLGDWIARRGVRDQIVLATKVAGVLTRERIIDSAKQSLDRLQTDRIDLFQLHNWDDETPLEETLAALTELLQQGQVRHVGVSNWTAEQLAQAQQVAAATGHQPLQSIQPPYNLVQREIESDVLPLCSAQNVGVISYSPLGAGFLTGKYRRNGPVPKGTRFEIIPGHQPIYMHDHGFAVLDRLLSVAERIGAPPPKVALSWVLHQPGVTSVLIGARSTEQVDQAFDAEALSLDQQTLADLAG